MGPSHHLFALVIIFEVVWRGGESAALPTTSGLSGVGDLKSTPVVTVDIQRKSSLPSLNRVLGCCTQEQWAYRDKIFQRDQTLGPLNLQSYRYQLALQDGELGPDGEFVDSEHTQLDIILAIQSAVSREVFITVGYPWSTRAQEIVRQGFPPGWEDYWRRTFESVAYKLSRPPYWVGKKMYISLLGEPDFPLWTWVYGTDEQIIFRATKIAHDAFKAYPDNFVVGGCGFALASFDWLSRFLDYYKANGMRFDFISWHTFLNWADKDNPATNPYANDPAADVGLRLRMLVDLLKAKGLPYLANNIVVAEYNFFNPDLTHSCGFVPGSPFNARKTITHYQSCARTLSALDIILNQPLIRRMYWSQGAGFIQTPGRDRPDLPEYKYMFAYVPLSVYDQFRGDVWHYKGAYYAFWFYGQLQGARVDAQVSNPNLGVWATRSATHVRVVLWNRSTAPAKATLSLLGVDPQWQCTLYRVDSATFQIPTDPYSEDAVISTPTSITPHIRPGVRTVAGALQFFSKTTLMPEASFFLVIRRRRW